MCFIVTEETVNEAQKYLDNGDEIYFSGFEFAVPVDYIPDPEELQEKLKCFDAVDCDFQFDRDNWNVSVIAFGVFFHTIDDLIVEFIATKMELAYLLKIDPFDHRFKFSLRVEKWY